MVMRPQHVLLAILVPVIWGGGFLFAKAAINHFPPILLMALRFTVTAVTLIWFVRMPRELMMRIFWVALVSAAIQYSLTFTGLRDLDASTAIIIVQLEVPFSVLLAVVFLKDHISPRQVLGILIAFLGVIIIAGGPRLDEDLRPMLLVAAGSLTWGAGQVMVKTLGEVGGFTLIAWVAVFAAPQLFISSLLFESGQLEAIQTASPLVWIAVAYLGVVMTAVGYAIWYYLLGRYTVNQVMPFLLLLPVVTVTGGVLLLEESLSATLAVGAGVTIAGVAMIILTRRRAEV